MKITIVSDPTGCSHITVNGKTLHTPNGGIFARHWSQQDIQGLLSDKDYNAYLQGKREFTMTRAQLWDATKDIRFFNPKKY